MQLCTQIASNCDQYHGKLNGLVHYCNEDMPYYMVPRFVDFVAELPKNTSEKVEKYKLRASAQGRLAEIWDRERAGIVIRR